MNHARNLFVIAITLLAMNLAIFAQKPRAIQGIIDENDVVRRANDVHRLARPEFDRGRMNPEEKLSHMMLVLNMRPGGEQEARDLLKQQQDRMSPLFHHWLTPDELADRFALSEEDMNTIIAWLRSHGLTIETLGETRQSIVFSGTVGQVESAFQTEMHHYDVNGERHLANAVPTAIPRALARAVKGVLSLHDFHSRPAFNTAQSPSGHALSPADFGKIYNVQPLWGGSMGNASRVVVLGKGNFQESDVAAFRNTYLPFAPSFVRSYLPVRASTPYILNAFSASANDKEATLDVEWVGAVAPAAGITYVGVSPSPNGMTDPIMLAADWAVGHFTSAIMNMNYSLCEAQNESRAVPGVDTTYKGFFDDFMYATSAAGDTVIVSAGDDGAAGCMDPNMSFVEPLGNFSINMFCGHEWVTCVGGTQFVDSSANWALSNAADGSSILPMPACNPLNNNCYRLPEQAWNESSTVTAAQWATGGGPSRYYSQPAYQVGFPGVPQDGWRHVPDVSLNAAKHTPYLIYFNGAQNFVFGTSASAAAFSGMVAYLQTFARDETGGTVQGLGPINTQLYEMTAYEFGSPFQDVTTGNNAVPYTNTTCRLVLGTLKCTKTYGSSGYSAGVGFDQTTGLGSIDLMRLISAYGGTFF